MVCTSLKLQVDGLQHEMDDFDVLQKIVLLVLFIQLRKHRHAGDIGRGRGKGGGIINGGEGMDVKDEKFS